MILVVPVFCRIRPVRPAIRWARISLTQEHSVGGAGPFSGSLLSPCAALRERRCSSSCCYSPQPVLRGTVRSLRQLSRCAAIVPIGVVKVGVEVVSRSLCGTVLSWCRYYHKWDWNMSTRSPYQWKNTVVWLLVLGIILIVFLPMLEDVTLLWVPERLTMILGVGVWIVAGGVYLLFVR
jgi:hypothetical protein